MAAGCSAPPGSGDGDRPGATGDPVRLVLQVTVDQLRADLPLRVRERWGPGGFRRLYDEGAVFLDAHHGHAITETVVGHATLATGADPSAHGMVGNIWFERDARRLRQNFEDPAYPVVGEAVEAAGQEEHPALPQGTEGRSPTAMLVPAIADSISAASGDRAKVFAVSFKDRAAIPMAGTSGKAFWWSRSCGRFVSSSWYYPDGALPGWVQAWNQRRRADRYDGRAWTLLFDLSTYLARDADDSAWEIPPAGMGRTFPHRFDREALGADFYGALASSPFADELLVDFTRELIRAEGLGDDDVPDYLSVALSATDYVGHRFGPSSLETEDQVLRVDRLIADLLEAADEAAGPGRTLVVLSADHGVAEIPEKLQADGREGGRVSLREVEGGEPFARLHRELGQDPVLRQWPPYVYLDRDGLGERGLDVPAAARSLADAMTASPRIEAAYTREQILGGNLPPDRIAAAVRRSFHPDRSGDIHVVARRGWQISYGRPGSRLRFATGHGSPWDYDSLVPLVFAGPGVRPGQVRRRVETVDAAPTIAALLGIGAPSGATGRVLPEALASSRD